MTAVVVGSACAASFLLGVMVGWSRGRARRDRARWLRWARGRRASSPARLRGMFTRREA